MTDEEMIDELRLMTYYPVGLSPNKQRYGWFALSVTEANGSGFICSWMEGLHPMQIDYCKWEDRKDYYTNNIGEHLKTLYEKCKKYNDIKIKEEEDREARNRERAIQLIKDL